MASRLVGLCLLISCSFQVATATQEQLVDTSATNDVLTKSLALEKPTSETPPVIGEIVSLIDEEPVVATYATVSMDDQISLLQRQHKVYSGVKAQKDKHKNDQGKAHAAEKENHKDSHKSVKSGKSAVLTSAELEKYGDFRKTNKKTKEVTAPVSLISKSNSTLLKKRHQSGSMDYLPNFFTDTRTRQSDHKCLTTTGTREFCLCQVGRSEGFMCKFECSCANGECHASACRITNAFVMFIGLLTISMAVIPGYFVFSAHEKKNQQKRWTASMQARVRAAAIDSSSAAHSRPAPRSNPTPVSEPTPRSEYRANFVSDDSESRFEPDTTSFGAKSIFGSDIAPTSVSTSSICGSDITTTSASTSSIFGSDITAMDGLSRPLDLTGSDMSSYEQTDADEKTVAIIGGGMAAIATMLELHSRGFKVTLMETNSSIRGVWAKSFQHNLNIPLAHFLGWKLPKAFPKRPNEAQIESFLNEFVDQHSLRSHIKFGTSVTKVIKRAGGGFTLITQSQGEQPHVENFSELVVSTGMFSNPLMPKEENNGDIASANLSTRSHSVSETSTSFSKEDQVITADPRTFGRSKSAINILNEVANRYLKQIDTNNMDTNNTLEKTIIPYNLETAKTDNVETAKIDDFVFPTTSAPVMSQQAVDESVPTYIPVNVDHPRNFADRYRTELRLVGDTFKQLIIVTMYNEHGDELARTLQGILENHENFVKKGGSWHEVVLCIVSDGVTKISQSSLDFCENFGIMNKEDMESDQEVSTHMWYSIPEVQKDAGSFSGSFPPLQMLVILKEENKGKLHSHMWAFNGIAPLCKPKYCFLIDVGTIPNERAVQMLYEEMEKNPSIGGCCGEITPVMSCNPLVWAQSFEYKISHVLDKSFESVFGFISVLPGAFSAYRYEAIEGRPLQKYFSSSQKKLSELGAFRANMYLAEDRILCFELICQKDRAWTLHYVKNALATTDVPSTLLELLKQRRRWLNGSFFAMVYVLMHTPQFWSGGNHSLGRKAAITFELLYFLCATTLNWFMTGSLFVCIYYTVKLGFFKDIHPLVLSILIMYVLSIIVQLILALGHPPEHCEWIYQGIAFSYGILMILLLYTAIDYSLVQNPSWWYRAAFLVTFGGYFVAGIMHGEFSVFLTYLNYFFLLPTFLTIFTIYSFCNIDDLSWGTKNAQLNAEEMKARGLFKVFRTKILMTWLLSNIALVMILTLFDLNRIYIVVLAFVGATFVGSKLIGSMLYLIQEFFPACRSGSGGAGKSKSFDPYAYEQFQCHYDPGHVGGGFNTASC